MSESSDGESTFQLLQDSPEDSSISSPIPLSDLAVDPKDLDFDILEENLRHPSAPKPKKINYIRERCECKRLSYSLS